MEKSEHGSRVLKPVPSVNDQTFKIALRILDRRFTVRGRDRSITVYRVYRDEDRD